VRVLLAAVVDDPSKVSPGIVGFLVTFALALATWFLLRNMVGRLRRLRSRPDPATEDDATRSSGPSSSAGTESTGKTAATSTGTAKKAGPTSKSAPKRP
jgi:hypothetical protein